MCGIFGLILEPESKLIPMSKSIMTSLFHLSESRGKEASGIAMHHPDSIYLAKSPLPASKFTRQQIYLDLHNKINTNGNDNCMCMMGHSRLVTNGGHQIHQNNQPVVAEGIVGIHNGIITNVDDLWQQYPMLDKQSDLDTEVMLKLIRKFYNEGAGLLKAIQLAYAQIEGVASLALLFEDFNDFVISTNNGSLYWILDQAQHSLIFASEHYILRTLLKKENLASHFVGSSIQHVRPGEGYLISLNDLRISPFSVGGNGIVSQDKVEVAFSSRNVIDVSTSTKTEHVTIPGEGPYVLSPSFVDEYPDNKAAISHLRRCKKCVLPETMPFIEFNEDGVCNYCTEYTPIKFKGMDALREALSPYRSKNGEPDCLLTLSGGRDSSYSAHIIRTKLGMNPVTYTYDWGMITDLARRNQMRICGKLGLENILVSADLAYKRGNIRKNVLAWLQKPDLGLVPLFMAGDKQYFYYANQVSNQVGVKLTILGENLLETTRFKTGFCGIPPQHGSEHTYTLSLFNKARLAWYYGSNYVTNPAYLNRSILDTLGAFTSYYFIPHNYLNIYEYVQWDEETINQTLIEEYNWETAPDTTTTWRIGDGTAAFYNYIYYTMAGLSEIDTFRSNQIREGMITRDEALQMIEVENQPRYESMQWYCDIIGIDFYEAVRRINSAPKLYQS